MMKTFHTRLSLWLLLLLPLSVPAQILDIDPVFPTIDDTVTIIYNATEGNGALAGTTPVYAHTGVITDQSTTPTDWKFVQGTWGTADNTVLMQDLGNDRHQIKYHIRSYYGFPAGTNVQELAFVFRDAAGNVVGRDTDGSDIYYPVFDGTVLEARFLAPASATIYEVGATVSFSAAASADATLTLEINGSQVEQVVGKSLSYAYSVPQAGNYTAILIAATTSDTKRDTLTFVGRAPTPVVAQPAGVINGINYLPGDTSVILSLYAPEKQYAYLIGDFNDWQPQAEYQMNQTPDANTYWLQVDGLNPGEEYAFQYLVDGQIRIGDPYTDKVLDPWNDGFISPSIYPNLKPYPSDQTAEPVSVLQTAQAPYTWQTNTWTRPEAKELVIYELLVRDFVSTHYYQTLIDSLDYLENLGVNAIELMPIMEFEGNTSWGYNPSFFFAPDKYYGTKDDLKAFIDECHRRGMVVILDMVLNHAFGQNPMVRLYWDGANNRPAANSPWFNPIPKHPFNVGYDFNHESQATKDFTDRVLAYWVEEYRFDGYRMDLSKGFTQVDYGSDVGAWSNYDASRIALLKRMFDELRGVDSSAYFILEHFATGSEEIELSDHGMMTWGNHVHDYNEATMGYLPNSNFSGISYQQRGWNEPHLVGYMESHDEERLMYKNLQFGNEAGSYSTKDLNTALLRMEQAAAFFFTVPGPKMLWQFGELGYDVSIDFNGRTGEKPIRWNYFQDDNRRRLYNAYSAFIKLRNENETFKTEDFSLAVSGAFKRIHLNDPDMDVTIIGNFDVQSTNGSPNFQHTGWWYDFVSGDSINVTDVSASITLAAGEYHIYTDQRLDKPQIAVSAGAPLAQNFQLSVSPNPARGPVAFSYELPQAGSVQLDLFNLNGQRVRSLRLDNQPAGPGLLRWDGANEAGELLPAGMYLFRLQTPAGLRSGKVQRF